jgi:uncharacterized protein with HEPN domain
MSRNLNLYLNDILQGIEKVERFIADTDFEEFKSDDMRIDSVLYNLMVIGEAVKNIPEELQKQFPEIRWRDIARFRDRVVHHYFSIDLTVIWDIVQIHLPALRERVEEIRLNLGEDSEEPKE